MDILTAALFCIAACVLIKPLAGVASEVKLVCSVAAACLITLRFLDSWREISAALEDIFLQTGMRVFEDHFQKFGHLLRHSAWLRLLP